MATLAIADLAARWGSSAPRERLRDARKDLERKFLQNCAQCAGLAYAPPMTSSAYEPGDRVWRWWDAGYKMDPQPLTVVRVNRLTLTVRTDQGSTFRLPHHLVEGLWTYDG